jgi:hypothetical protein
VSVAKGPDVPKVRSLTEQCGLWFSVETYTVAKGPLQCKLCQRFGHTQRYCGALLVVRLTSQGSAVPWSSSLSAAAVKGSTQPTTEAVGNGKRPRRH